MRKLLISILLIGTLSGCAHCSRTDTTFNGKTKGINPYGDGNMVIVREAYWGNLKCILKMLGEEADVCEPIEVDD